MKKISHCKQSGSVITNKFHSTTQFNRSVNNFKLCICTNSSRFKIPSYENFRKSIFSSPRSSFCTSATQSTNLLHQAPLTTVPVTSPSIPRPLKTPKRRYPAWSRRHVIPDTIYDEILPSNEINRLSRDLHLLIASGDHAKAYELFHQMKKNGFYNINTCNTFLQLYQDNPEALVHFVYKDMKKMGIKPNSKTYTLLIHCLMKTGSNILGTPKEFIERFKKEMKDLNIFIFNPSLYSTILDAYAITGSLEDFLTTVEEHGVLGTKQNWLNLNFSDCTEADVEAIKKLFDKAIQHQIILSWRQCESALKVLYFHKEALGALTVFSYMQKQGFEIPTELYDLMLELLSRTNCKVMDKWWEKMEKIVSPSESNFFTLITAHGRENNAKMMEHYITQMMELKIPPSMEFVIGMITSGVPDMLLTLFEHMKANNMLSVELFNEIVKYYLENGDLANGQKWFKKMKEFGFTPDATSRKLYRQTLYPSSKVPENKSTE